MNDLYPNVCRYDIGHTGRCADGLGGTWANNHPTCEGCVRRGRWAAIAMAERDEAEAAMVAMRRASELLDALTTLTVLVLENDDWQPADHDTAEDAALRLAPLLGVRRGPRRAVVAEDVERQAAAKR